MDPGMEEAATMDSEQSGSARSKIAMLRGVRQVRQFSADPVPREVIDGILEVARWTGSGMNNQPWEFVLVRNQDTLRAIAEAEGAGSHLAGANFAVIVVMPGTGGEIQTYDEGRLAERLLLAAEVQGVGAGIWWFKDGGAAAKRILGIPEDRKVRTAVSYGYPRQDPAGAAEKRSGGRKPLAALVHEEHY
jgi:nitroreductase